MNKNYGKQILQHKFVSHEQGYSMYKTITERNNVRVFGKGAQPMLFAHGFGCDQNMWRFITPAFENDYKIILAIVYGRR